jgi:hypothetical protein
MVLAWLHFSMLCNVGAVVRSMLTTAAPEALWHARRWSTWTGPKIVA